MTHESAIVIDDNAPWPGLQSYDENSRRWFFGRDNETSELLRLVRREPLTILYGRSGLGKTSLLQAGLFPRLREEGFFPLRIRLDFSDGAPDSITQIWQEISNQCRLHHVQPPVPQTGENTLWEFFNQREADFWSADDRILNPVLVFDQFEEIFTLGRQEASRRARCEALLTQIGDLVENRRPETLRARLECDPSLTTRFTSRRERVRIIFSFREDYLPDFDVLYGYIRARTSNRLRLQPMEADAAETAIIAAGSGRIVTHEVAQTIVRFVSGSETRRDHITVEPALLSLVCYELNDLRIRRNAPEITADLLHGDRTKHILEKFYIRGFAGLNVEVQHFVEDRLLTATGYRDSYALDNVLNQHVVSEAALQTLVNRRILRREERNGQMRLELIHDVLAGVAKASRDAREAQTAYNTVLHRQKKLSGILGFIVFLLLLQGFIRDAPSLFWDSRALLFVAGGAIAMSMTAYGGRETVNTLLSLTVIFRKELPHIDLTLRNRVGELYRHVYASAAVAMLEGYIEIFANLSDPSAIGPSLAFQLLSGIYAVFLAECVVRPAMYRIHSVLASSGIGMLQLGKSNFDLFILRGYVLAAGIPFVTLLIILLAIG